MNRDIASTSGCKQPLSLLNQLPPILVSQDAVKDHNQKLHNVPSSQNNLVLNSQKKHEMDRACSKGEKRNE